MRQSLGRVVVVLLLGVVIGAVFSEVIGLFLREGSVPSNCSCGTCRSGRRPSS